MSKKFEKKFDAPAAADQQKPEPGGAVRTDQVLVVETKLKADAPQNDLAEVDEQIVQTYLAEKKLPPSFSALVRLCYQHKIDLRHRDLSRLGRIILGKIKDVLVQPQSCPESKPIAVTAEMFDVEHLPDWMWQLLTEQPIGEILNNLIPTVDDILPEITPSTAETVMKIIDILEPREVLDAAGQRKFSATGRMAHLTGPTGVGKTTIAKTIGFLLNQPVIQETGSRFARVENYYYEVEIKKNADGAPEMRKVPGSLLLAASIGAIWLLDEATADDPNVLLTITQIIDKSEIYIPGKGYLKIHPDFKVVFTSNPNYGGNQDASAAINRRAPQIPIDILPSGEELALAEKFGRLREYPDSQFARKLNENYNITHPVQFTRESIVAFVGTFQLLRTKVAHYGEGEDKVKFIDHFSTRKMLQMVEMALLTGITNARDLFLNFFPKPFSRADQLRFDRDIRTCNTELAYDSAIRLNAPAENDATMGTTILAALTAKDGDFMTLMKGLILKEEDADLQRNFCEVVGAKPNAITRIEELHFSFQYEGTFSPREAQKYQQLCAAAQIDWGKVGKKSSPETNRVRAPELIADTAIVAAAQNFAQRCKLGGKKGIEPDAAGEQQGPATKVFSAEVFKRRQKILPFTIDEADEKIEGVILLGSAAKFADGRFFDPENPGTIYVQDRDVLRRMWTPCVVDRSGQILVNMNTGEIQEGSLTPKLTAAGFQAYRQLNFQSDDPTEKELWHDIDRKMEFVFSQTHKLTSDFIGGKNAEKSDGILCQSFQVRGDGEKSLSQQQGRELRYFTPTMIRNLELLRACDMSGGAALITGPSGTGKSSLAKAYAEITAVTDADGNTRQREYIDIDCHETTGPEILKFKSFEKGKLLVVDGPLYDAMINGKVGELREINNALADKIMFLLTVLDENGVFYREENGELKPFKAHRDFFLIATRNPLKKEYVGVKPLNTALVNRFKLYLDLGYPNPEEEAWLLEAFYQDNRAPAWSDDLSKNQEIRTTVFQTLAKVLHSIRVLHENTENILSIQEITKYLPKSPDQIFTIMARAAGLKSFMQEILAGIQKSLGRLSAQVVKASEQMITELAKKQPHEIQTELTRQLEDMAANVDVKYLNHEGKLSDAAQKRFTEIQDKIAAFEQLKRQLQLERNSQQREVLKHSFEQQQTTPARLQEIFEAIEKFNEQYVLQKFVQQTVSRTWINIISESLDALDKLNI